jgi:DNA-binding CsgD family transcriptional regulator
VTAIAPTHETTETESDMTYAMELDLGTTYAAAAVWRAGTAEMVGLGTHGHEVSSDATAPATASSFRRERRAPVMSMTTVARPAGTTTTAGEAGFGRFLGTTDPTDASDGTTVALGTGDAGVVSAALDRAAAGRATRVTICGTAGSGRTNLIEHARRDAKRVSMRVLATHGRAGDADIPYSSMLTLLHPVMDRIPDLPPSERDSLYAALELRAADVDDRAARTGLWRLLTRLGEDGPLLVTADDSDLMDDASLRVLAFALGRMDSQRVAAFATADCHRSSNPLVAIGDELIVLDGLDRESLVRSVHATVPATDWAVRRMASFAGGNSAVATQLVRSLAADQRAGRAACPPVPIPPRELVRALAPMLEPLGSDAQAALVVIAADTTDDVDVIRAALRALGHSGDPVAALEQANLIAVVGASVRMRQPMLEVVAYDRLSPAERRAVHTALASVMTAPHHEAGRAWQLANGAEGPDTGVARAMSAVARSAAGRGELRVAAVAHARAAEFAEDHDERSRQIVSALGHWTALGDQIAMRRLLNEPHDDAVATRVARSAAVRWLDGDASAVVELRAAAVGATERERSLIDALFADAAFASGRARDAIEAARRVVRREESGAALNLVEALLVLTGQATPSRLSPLDPPGDGRDEVVGSRAMLRHAQAHLLFGDVASAEHALSGSDGGAPLPWDPAERTATRARLSAAQGHPATAGQMLIGALDQLPRSATIARAVLREAIAETQFLLGDGEAAMSTLDDVVPVFRQAGMARLEASAHSTVGRIAWSVGQTDVAVACLERARRIDPCAPIGDLVALLCALGRDSDARAWLARIDSRPGDGSAPIDVLRARCNTTADTNGFQQVTEILRKGHLVVSEAELLIDLAAWHHRRSRWTDVYRAAEQAARLLIPSGIRGWVDRLDGLTPPDGASSDDVPQVLFPLTDAERRVALAVSRGLTNKEVAAELFVSIKTVDSHLQRIYPKLQIRSRSELAARVNAAMASSGTGLGSATGSPPDVRR